MEKASSVLAKKIQAVEKIYKISSEIVWRHRGKIEMGNGLKQRRRFNFNFSGL